MAKNPSSGFTTSRVTFGRMVRLCRDHRMPVRVFMMEKTGALLNIVRGGDDGTLIE